MSDFLINVENVLQALSAGVLLGGIYGLMCVGLGIIFGVMRVINFGQGDLMIVGMYCAFYLFGAPGLSSDRRPSRSSRSFHRVPGRSRRSLAIL